MTIILHTCEHGTLDLVEQPGGSVIFRESYQTGAVVYNLGPNAPRQLCDGENIKLGLEVAAWRRFRMT